MASSCFFVAHRTTCLGAESRMGKLQLLIGDLAPAAAEGMEAPQDLGSFLLPLSPQKEDNSNGSQPTTSCRVLSDLGDIKSSYPRPHLKGNSLFNFASSN